MGVIVDESHMASVRIKMTGRWGRETNKYRLQIVLSITNGSNQRQTIILVQERGTESDI